MGRYGYILKAHVFCGIGPALLSQNWGISSHFGLVLTYRRTGHHIADIYHSYRVEPRLSEPSGRRTIRSDNWGYNQVRINEIESHLAKNWDSLGDNQ